MPSKTWNHAKKFHAKYYHFIGNREEARNFGIEKAKDEWIYTSSLKSAVTTHFPKLSENSSPFFISAF
jgi:hypothetical protein